MIGGDLPTTSEIFENNILELNDEMTDDEILMLLKYFINNYENFNENLNNLENKINKEYGLDKYIEKILNIINENTKQGVFSLCVCGDTTYHNDHNDHYKMLLDMLIMNTNSYKISYENIIKIKIILKNI